MEALVPEEAAGKEGPGRDEAEELVRPHLLRGCPGAGFGSLFPEIQIQLVVFGGMGIVNHGVAVEVANSAEKIGEQGLGAIGVIFAVKGRLRGEGSVETRRDGGIDSSEGVRDTGSCKSQQHDWQRACKTYTAWDPGLLPERRRYQTAQQSAWSFAAATRRTSKAPLKPFCTNCMFPSPRLCVCGNVSEAFMALTLSRKMAGGQKSATAEQVEQTPTLTLRLPQFVRGNMQAVERGCLVLGNRVADV